MAGLLIFAGLFSVWSQCSSGDPTKEDDWRRAAQAAVELAEPTDGIRVTPSWSEAPLPHLGPVGNLLHRHHHPMLEDLLEIERLLILSEVGRRDEAMDRLPFDASSVKSKSFGTVELLSVEVPPALRIHGDLISELNRAEVSYIGPDDEQDRCRYHRRQGYWQCDGSGQDGRVGPILLEVDHDPRRCIQAFPPSGDRHLQVEFDAPQLSDVLRIRAGLDNRAARLERGGDVIYRLYFDEQLVDQVTLNAHRSTWNAHDIDTTGFDGGAAIRIEVESVAPEPHHRRFCFNGWPLTREQAEQ